MLHLLDKPEVAKVDRVFSASVYSRQWAEFMDDVCVIAEDMAQARIMFEAIAALHGHDRPQCCVFHLAEVV